MLPLVQIIFVSSNTDSQLTHQASVTQLCPAWVVTGLEVGQRLGGDTVEAIRLPGATLGATYTMVLFACVCMINEFNFEYNDLVTWALWPSWFTRNVCPDCSEPRVVVLGIRMEPYCDTSAAAAADEGSWDGKTVAAICRRSSTTVLLAEGSIGYLNIVWIALFTHQTGFSGTETLILFLM